MTLPILYYQTMNKYQYTLDGVDYDVEIISVENNIAEVKVNDKTFNVKVKDHIKPTRPQRVHLNAPQTANDDASVYRSEKVSADTLNLEGEKVYAPLPGTVTEIRVNVGDSVKAGQTVIVLEAMKMQNNIECDVPGRVSAILVKPGDTVMEGAALLTIKA